MRVLAISSPSVTHFMPAVPLLWAARAAGHEVMFLGQPDVTGMAEAAGLPTVTTGALFDAGEFFHALPAGKRPIEAGIAQVPPGGWQNVGMAWIYHAKYLLEPYLEFAREWKPDVVLTDPLDYSGLIVGGAVGAVTVHHRWGAELMTPAGLGLAKKLLRGRAARYGLTAVPDPDVVLDPFPASWALPEVEPGMPIRPVPYNGGGELPEWLRAQPGRLRVCATFGMATVRLNGLSLVRHVVDAFDGLDDVEAVITLDRASQELLGPVPEHVRLVEPVPIQGLVETSDLVVHHGGAGTVITTLMAGLPHLLLPQMMDQRARCERIAASGAAIQLDTAETQNDPATIRDALIELLDEPHYTNTAVNLREEADSLPSPGDITCMLEDLVAARR
jgi:UDP:flavonoid glycosyltransferase YjiC (YdhE family)